MSDDTTRPDLELPFLDEGLRGVAPSPVDDRTEEAPAEYETWREDEDDEEGYEGEFDEFDEGEVGEEEFDEGKVGEEELDEGEVGEEDLDSVEECEVDDEATAPETESTAGEPWAEFEATRPTGQILIVDENNAPLVDGQYAFHQGDVTERGTLAGGRALLGKIDPARPFVVEIPDRVCAIRLGAYLDPNDPAIQYGGTWFDWSLVRDDRKPDRQFWPHYHREMDRGAWTVDRFLQHEHITRRPIRIAKPFLGREGQVRLRATPVRIRVGPFVRYADHERAVIWLETVTPSMVRVRYRLAGGRGELSRHASTVRVGGRYFAAVEIDGLEPDTFYDYTVELAPLPAVGPIPIEQKDFAGVFPTLTARVVRWMRAQCADMSLGKSEWLAFRTLRRAYERKLRFATGSCRWYPNDKDRAGKSWGPDMLAKLGDWLRAHEADRTAAWPHFLFFCGDQIYVDEIGADHSDQLLRARIASRIPGPADPAASPRDKLVDGAWAGRFAHRYRPFNDPGEKEVVRLQKSLAKLDDIHKRYPDIKGIASDYPGADPAQKLRDRYRTVENKRKLGGATGEADDERKAREAIELLPVVHGLETSSEPFRILLLHWAAASQPPVRRNPMRGRYLCQNYLLWSIPDFAHQAPTITEGGGATVARKQDGRGHPSADDGRHAADFAEVAYLYERAWAVSRSVRMLLAHVPTFLMFDDHEVTDDWNFDLTWVRLLHNRGDAFRMWPKTMTDALAAYWIYQGWCNKSPSQWARKGDPRANCLAKAQRTGDDALPELRRLIHRACFTPPSPAADPKARYQAGTSLDWHYRLPFDPPFLVPDCRSRKLFVEGDDKLRVIDHELSNAPKSQTIDDAQLEWMRKILVDEWRGGPVAFIGPSTPLLLQKKVMAFMRTPEVVAAANRGKRELATLAALAAALLDSTKLGIATDALLRVFRRSNDLEHMIRDKSWRDLWSIVAAMRKGRSPVKTLVLVSGDVHHSYNMTANLSVRGRPTPELLQLTCSGLQTTIRKTFQRTLGEELGSLAFDVGPYRLVPGFVQKGGTGPPDLVLYENAVGIVDVTMGTDVDVVVTYLAGDDQHIYRYTSGPAYMKGGVPAVLAPYVTT